jgi:hypothetical protein
MMILFKGEGKRKFSIRYRSLGEESKADFVVRLGGEEGYFLSEAGA